MPAGQIFRFDKKRAHAAVAPQNIHIVAVAGGVELEQQYVGLFVCMVIARVGLGEEGVAHQMVAALPAVDDGFDRFDGVVAQALLLRPLI